MIAISYRREDSLPVTGRLYDRLQAEFGQGKVFMDFDSIPYGVDFRDHIKQMIEGSKVLVAMIGPDWVGKRRRGSRRIDDPTDFVRLELAYALQRNLPIIPVLISNTRMPKAEELPKDIEGLAFRNGLNLDAGIDFHHHAERLVIAINRLLIEPPARLTSPKETPALPKPPQKSPASPEAQLGSPKILSVPPPIPQPPLHEELSFESKVEAKARVTKASPQPTADTPSEKPQFDVSERQGDSVLPHTVEKTNFLKRAQQRIGYLQNKLVADFVRPLDDTESRRPVASLKSAKKIIRFVLGGVIVAAFVFGVGFWGSHFFRSEDKDTQSLPELVTKPITQEPPKALSQPTMPVQAQPSIAQATSSPIRTASPITRPTPSEGALWIDSSPQGAAYEVIDGNGKHYTGKTPDFIHVPTGYAQVIQKHESQEHRSLVWISARETTSNSWHFTTVATIAPVQVSPQPQSSVSPAATVAANVTPLQSQPPSTTSMATPTGENWQARVADFVRQFIALNQLQDANATVGFYAPTVDYFDTRGKDHAYILRDVQKYNTQWPARRDSIDGNIQVEEKVPNQQYRASFKLALYAENPKTTEWSKGEMSMTLDVNIIGGAPKIAAINQKRLQHHNGRGKGPRPPEMEAALRPIDPSKLTKVLVKKYGFFALLPTDIFPDAETKLSDGVTDHINAIRGCAAVSFTGSRETVRSAYDDCLAQFYKAPDHRKVDYKVIRDNWFVISAGTHTTGYYTKGVKHGDDVFVMELEYGDVCIIPNATLAQISHAFDGSTDAAPAGTNPSPSPGSTPAGSGGEKIEPKLVSVKIKKYGVSAALPPEVFPDVEKLSHDNETFLRGKSWSGRTTLRFFSTQQSLNKAYAEFVAKHTTDYKVLKSDWFAVSGDLGMVNGAYMGFYVKGIKKGNQVVIMDLEYQDDDFPFGEETFNSIVRSFARN
jgi:hypothetical protein